MKKFLAFLIPLLVCLLMFGCTNSNTEKDNNGNTTTDTNTQNNNNPTTNNQGTNGTGNKDTVKSNEEVATLIGSKYLITVKIDSSYTDGSGEYVNEFVQYTTVSDGTYSYWGASLEDLSRGSLYKRCSDGSLVHYSYSEEAEGFNEMMVFPTEINPFRSVNTIFLANTEIEYTTKSTVSFLGRACTQYNYTDTSSTLGASASIERMWIIDNTTGACLKYNASVSGNGFGISAGASGNFEVTEFDQSTKVDQCIKTITDKILVNEWDTSVLEKFGLKDTNGSHIDFSEILKSANISSTLVQVREAGNDVYEDTGNGSYSTEYFINLSLANGEELVKTIIRNLYNCGAKCDDEGTVHNDPLDEPLCYIDRDDNLAYTFFATTGAQDYYIEFRGEWNPYINGGVWSITLNVFYKNS